MNREDGGCLGGRRRGYVTYTIMYENPDTEVYTLKWLYDDLPDDFGYVSGSSVFALEDGTVVYSGNPSTDLFGAKR